MTTQMIENAAPAPDNMAAALACNEPRSFIVYPNTYELAEDLSLEQKGLLWEVQFALNGCCEMPELDRETKIVAKQMDFYMTQNRQKWLEKQARKQAEWEAGQEARTEKARRAANIRWHGDPNGPQDAELCDAMLEHAYINDTVTATGNGNANVTETESATGMGPSPWTADTPAQVTSPWPADAGEGCAAGAAPGARDASPSGRQKPSTKEVEAHFEALWALYPTKRGKSAVSETTRRKLYDIPVDAMAEAIDRYRAEVKADDRKLLFGSTWFNGRYEDFYGDNYVSLPSVASMPSGGRAPKNQYQASSRGMTGPDEDRDFSYMEE